ncbi:hypothetical protein FH972_025709 [Carpinus fangiana]|uniref:dihydroorotase n=1 Tax=Carpinus fangiana TaxID=176857 RepID=A0A5N6L1S7_9ROSI|nr:hypothetical protein FH972_025709 [Carpinus fangiana]
MHVHLRDGPMADLVTPTIRAGGVDTVFVMPNLVPPITTVAHCLQYRDKLRALAPDVTFLMSLYLHPSITPAVVAEAAAAGITGIKSYPAGVTTNSASGVVSYEPFYPVFQAMEQHDIVLNLHGELPPSAAKDGAPITVLNAEEAFLPTLLDLHRRFPRLRIILEHCTTAAALDAVRGCGPTVAATITAHHLHLIVDDWAGDPHSFCKPVAKLPSDRVALLKAAVGGEGRFFFGSDSAPHPVLAKRGGEDGRAKTAAGCFTQPFGVQLVVDAIRRGLEQGILGEGDVTKEALVEFLSGNGRKFYRVERPQGERTLRVERKGQTTPDFVRNGDGSVTVVPFWSGRDLPSLRWI